MNIGKTLSDINHSRILYDPPPRILKIKAKINKWDLIKIKSFCTTKENISKVKRQPPEWEKIIANETTDKQLISKIYKVFFIIGDWNAKVGSQEIPGVTGKFGHGVQNEAGQRLIIILPKEHTGHSKHPLPTTQEKTLHMDITRLLIPKSDW